MIDVRRLTAGSHLAILIVSCAAVACTGTDGRSDAPNAASRAETTGAAVESTPWYRGVRTLDLTGDGRADSVRLEATGSRLDSMQVTIVFVVDGAVQHRARWGSDYELALPDTSQGADSATVLRGRLDQVLASVAVRPMGDAMAEDSAALAGLSARPTQVISYQYGYETTVRMVWDAARQRFVGLWSCC